MKRHLILPAMVLLVAGCSSTSTSNYHYAANASDPVLEFTADFGSRTIPPIHFAVNVDQPESTKCDDFDEVGYYYPESSVFIFADANKELSAKVPANKFVTVKGHYNLSGEGSCYASLKQFTAEEGKTYLVNYTLKNKMCELVITDKQTSEPVKVKVKAKSCTR